MNTKEKIMAEKFGNDKGSKPIQGNISDNQLHLILNIPKQTLIDWKKSDSYRKDLYWFLKTMTKEEIEEHKTKSKKFIEGN